ncbi:MAG: hydrogenase iron-sulfur subunit [Myxococcales bacterium]|nr:MAG: hydrogenase iron-sulfur subunit [Myxococcales bacterium]
MAEFEPTIVAFCCNYCAFAAADLAGSMRLQYPPNVRIIRLPCSGRAELQEVLNAFLNGADGVLVVGCMEGDCHFIGGNFKAKKRMQRAKKLLQEAHISPERLEFRNNSAAMGPQLAKLFTDFTEKIRAQGPCFAAPESLKSEVRA